MSATRSRGDSPGGAGRSQSPEAQVRGGRAADTGSDFPDEGGGPGAAGTRPVPLGRPSGPPAGGPPFRWRRGAGVSAPRSVPHFLFTLVPSIDKKPYMCSSSLHWTPFQARGGAGAAASGSCVPRNPAPPGRLAAQPPAPQRGARRKQPQQALSTRPRAGEGASRQAQGWGALTGGRGSVCAHVCVFTGVLPAASPVGADKVEEQVGAPERASRAPAQLPPQRRGVLVLSQGFPSAPLAASHPLCPRSCPASSLPPASPGRLPGHRVGPCPQGRWETQAPPLASLTLGLRAPAGCYARAHLQGPAWRAGAGQRRAAGDGWAWGARGPVSRQQKAPVGLPAHLLHLGRCLQSLRAPLRAPDPGCRRVLSGALGRGLQAQGRGQGGRLPVLRTEGPSRSGRQTPEALKPTHPPPARIPAEARSSAFSVPPDRGWRATTLRLVLYAQHLFHPVAAPTARPSLRSSVICSPETVFGPLQAA